MPSRRFTTRANEYDVTEASRITGIKESTIRYWAGGLGGVIQAEVADLGVRGSRKLFSARNLVQMRVAYLLMQEAWPQPVVARELPRIVSAQDVEWFEPTAKTAQLPAWLLFADRLVGKWKRRWKFEEVWRPGSQLQPSGWALSQVLHQFMDAEVVTISWPDGFSSATGGARRDLRELEGVKRLSAVNLQVVRQRIVESL